MIKQSLLTKKVKSTRTYKYKIVGNTSYLDKQFKKIQTCRRLYFNYALQYLYQHYGVKHLNIYLPDRVTNKRILIGKLIAFARAKALQHHIDLKKMDYSVQSIDKMLMELITNFAKYRHLQYQTKYWSMTKRAKYLKKHNCNLTGFGRINYKHNDVDLISTTFKQQVYHNSKGQLSYNAIRLQNNPHCHVTHDRDHNSTIDIIDFTLHPEKHPILQEPRFHYLTVDDLVNAY